MTVCYICFEQNDMKEINIPQEELIYCETDPRHSILFLYPRAVFTLWFVAWQRNIEQREAIQETLTRDMLRGALLSWRQNVVRLRMRQKKAVVILEHCHLKQTFKCWRLYTARRGILKYDNSRVCLFAPFSRARLSKIVY